MPVDDLVFKIKATGKRIFDPLKMDSGTSTITITNLGTETIEDLGIYIVPSTNLGPVEYPAEVPPETDYEDLLEWGTATDVGATTAGGLKLTVPQDSGTNTYYVTRTQGSLFKNKIDIVDIDPSQTIDVDIEVETPAGTEARRLFIRIVVE